MTPDETNELRRQYDQEAKLRYKELYAKSRLSRIERIREYQEERSSRHEQAIEADHEAIEARIDAMRAAKRAFPDSGFNVPQSLLDRVKLD